MKRLFSLLLCVVMLLSIFPITAIQTSAATDNVTQTAFTGSGTKSDPYIANTSSELFGFVEYIYQTRCEYDTFRRSAC